MDAYEIIIVGNGEPALVCSLSAKNNYPEKNIAIIKSEKGMSFIEDVLFPISGSPNKKLTVFYDEISGKSHNTLLLKSGKKIQFEKLVLITGSRAIEPPIDGIKKDGVFLINNDPRDMHKIIHEALDAENIVIFGGGYIGVELSDELLRFGKKVILIEKSTRLMPSSFDADISNKAKEIIENLGGNVLLNTKIKSVLGIDSISGIKLNNGKIMDCDFLIVCGGTRPNIEAAEKLGIIYDKDRGILIDEFFRTSDKDVFAVGECAAKYDFFNSDLANVLLNNSKMEEAKLLGANLYSVIFNRGKMIDYITEKRSIKDNLSVELKVMEVYNGSKDYLPLR